MADNTTEDVIITVSGGVAEVVQGIATVIDYDNIKEEVWQAEAGEAAIPEYCEVTREFLKKYAPQLWDRIEALSEGDEDGDEEDENENAETV